MHECQNKGLEKKGNLSGPEKKRRESKRRAEGIEFRIRNCWYRRSSGNPAGPRLGDGNGLREAYDSGEERCPVLNNERQNRRRRYLAGKRVLRQTLGESSAPAGTAPAAMSYGSIPARPPATTRGTVRACASFRGRHRKEAACCPPSESLAQRSEEREAASEGSPWSLLVARL